jgi:hypothetical protein
MRVKINLRPHVNFALLCRLAETTTAYMFVNIFCTKFRQYIKKSLESRVKFHVRPEVYYDFGCTYCHETC